MSKVAKAPIIQQDTVVEQVKEMTAQKKQLEIQVDILTARLKMIESSLSENDILKKKCAELLAESLKLQREEWKRRATYYPDIRLQLLSKALEVIAPPQQKKKP